MKKSFFYFVPTVVCLVFVVILTTFFGSKKETKLIPSQIGEEIAVFSEDENKNAVVFATSKNSKRAFSDFVSTLQKNGADVFVVSLKAYDDENDDKLKEAFSLIEKEKQYEKTAFVGFDVGGFEGLRFVSENSPELDGACFLAPNFNRYNEKDLSIKDGSYVLNVPWVMELKKQSFSFPVLILSSVSDDFCTPQLSSLIYNHLSDDDIQRSVSSFSAKKGNIALSVETGVFHRLVPFSGKILSKTMSFLSNDAGFGLTKESYNNSIKEVLWVLTAASLVLSLSFLYYYLGKTFVDVTQNLFGSNNKKTALMFFQKILTMALSAVFVFIIYLGFKNTFNFGIAFFVTAFFFVSELLSLIFIGIFILPKGASLLKSMKMLSKSRNRHLSFLVVLLDFVVYFSVILSGYTYNAFSLRNIPAFLAIFLMSAFVILVFCYETEILKLLTKTKLMGLVYGLAHLIPFALIFVYSAVEINFALSFNAALLAILGAASALTALAMREIGAERLTYVSLSGAFFAICVLTLV